MVSRNLLLLLAGVSFSIISFAQTLDVQGKFKIDDGNSEGATITVSKNGSVVNTVAIKGSKFALDLEFNADYVLSFAKPGYITKKIAIDTHAPADMLADIEPVEFLLEIFKQYEGVNIVVFNQPVGMWRYMDELDGFGYDTDYTKSILSQIKEVEKQLAEKAKEEQTALAQAKQQQSAQAKAEAEAQKAAQAKAEEEARKAAAAAVAEEAKKQADAKATEEARKAAEAKEFAEAKAAAKAKEEEEKRKAAAALEEEKRKFAEAKAEEEKRRLAEAKAEEDRKAAQAKVFEEERKAAAAKAEEERKAAAAQLSVGPG